MDATTAHAGLLVRTLARFSPGMRRTAEQIPDFGRHWLKQNEATEANGGAPTWVVLGDSLGQGIGASTPAHGYVGQLQRMLQASNPPSELAAQLQSAGIINLSKSGARIRDVVDQQLPVIDSLGYKPLVVTVTIGNNDMLRTIGDRQLLAGFEQLCARLPSSACVATLPQLGSVRARSLNHKVRRLLEEAGLECADLGAMLTSWRGNQASDRFHPNDDGYRVWAEAFLIALSQ